MDVIRGLALVVLALTLVAWPGDSVRAAAPVVTINPNSVRIQVASAPLVETIDALARAASFKVTYEGARPTGMLFGAQIDTPTVAQTLFRLLDGQNLNYAVAFDLTGKKVTSLMILGVAPKVAPAAGPAAGGSRPQPVATPRTFLPPVDDDPAEEPEETPEPEPSPPPKGPAQGPGSPVSPFPVSPFAPRFPFGTPFGPRPTPAPNPPPAPTPSA
jgi:hypothetical protein